MSALLRLTATETKLYFREPIVVFFTLAFSPLLIVILGLIPSMREPDAGLGGVRQIALYLPVAVAMGISLFALSGLSQLFSSYREKGILRRLRTTPVKPSALLTAQLLMATSLSALSTLAILVIGRFVDDVRLPRLLPYLISFLLVALAMFTIGLLVASLAPTSKSASAIGTLVFFPLVFFAGLWVPRARMNHVLLTISDFSPLGAGVQSLQDASAGQWPHALHLAVMLGWTMVAGVLGARYFRWE